MVHIGLRRWKNIKNYLARRTSHLRAFVAQSQDAMTRWSTILARPTFPIAPFPHFQRKKNNTSQFFYRKVYIDCTIYRYAIVSPIQGQYLLITPMLTNSLICLGSQSQWDMLMSCLNKLFLNGTEARGWPPPAVISCPRPVCISFAANALVLALARSALFFF